MGKVLDIAGACERVGPGLQAKYDPDPIPGDVLIAAVVKECGCQKDSVLPWDRCYNNLNNGKPIQPLVFIKEGTKLFRFVGRNFPYTGPRYHKPKGKREAVIVGYWTDGKYEPIPSNE